MSEKVEIEIELLRDLVDAAGYVSTFHTMFVNHETPDNCGDLNAAEYLASEAILIEQRGRAVLEAVEHTLAPDGGEALLNYDPLPDIERISKQGYVSPAAGKA